ncbi:MAG: malonyl-ACP O-methyltransferase BioC [Enterobacteriaceae bacterium]
MDSHHYTLNKESIAHAFGRAAGSYDQVAQIQRASGHGLLQRLPDSLPGFCQVLDAGCGTGYFSRLLSQRGYKVNALDISSGMLQQAQSQHSAARYICADIEALPLADHCMDLCFSNLALQWCSDFSRALAELYRVTRPGGWIAFTTLVEGSLSELVQAWRQIDGYAHINRFPTYAHLLRLCQPYGASLQQQRLQQPYDTIIDLKKALQRVGSTQLQRKPHGGLLSRQKLARLERAYPKQQGKLFLSYQVVYGVIQHV